MTKKRNSHSTIMSKLSTKLELNGSVHAIRARQVIGKYKVERQIGAGGFARVYAAMDMIEGTRVALKIPYEQHVDEDMLKLFQQEVRLVAKLDHPNILPLRNADIVDGRFIVATSLGLETLGDRMERRIGVEKTLHFAKQMIAAVAYAHDYGIIHCDIKPENFILFKGDTLKLADFGIAKVSRMTIKASGTGTVGYMATEQAMGKPSMRSDVFSIGLIIYRMLAGAWPEYPFAWPPPKASNLRTKRVHPEMINLIKKAIDPLPRNRFADATKLQTEFEKIYPVALRNLKKSKRS